MIQSFMVLLKCFPLVLISFVLIACDRLEGKIKDASNDANSQVQSFRRDVLVSDLQKDAESKCAAVLTSEDFEYRWKSILRDVPDERGKGKLALDSSLSVTVRGDGKYDIHASVKPIGTPPLPAYDPPRLSGYCYVAGGVVQSRRVE